MVGDILYSRYLIDSETRAVMLDLHLGPFALEVIDPSDAAFQRVVAHARGKLLVVPYLDCVGNSFIEIADRLSAVSRGGGHVYDVLGGILGSAQQSEAIVRAFAWMRRFEFERQSRARSAGRRRAAPAGGMCSGCGHKQAAHDQGSGPCFLCPESSTCPGFRGAGPSPAPAPTAAQPPPPAANQGARP